MNLINLSSSAFGQPDGDGQAPIVSSFVLWHPTDDPGTSPNRSGF